MLSIGLHEFKSLLKSIKSIIVIGIIIGITYATATSFKEVPVELIELGQGVYSLGLILTVLILGLTFIATLSHDTVNREIHERTIRFLVTKVSRYKIILGKFIGISMFWALCLAISFILVMPFIGEFFWLGYLECILFMTFGVSVYLFLSTIINRPAISLFIGIIISLALPILGIWSIASNKFILQLLRWFNPYYYIYLGKGYPVIVLLMTILLVIGSMYSLERKDL